MARTNEQTQIAQFWTASPSAIWNTVASQMIEAWDLDLSESARVFALLYLAASDAGIACWDAEVHLQLLAADYRHSERPP